MSKEPKKPISIRLPDELVDWLKQYGEERGVGWQSALKLILYEKKGEKSHEYEKELTKLLRKTIKSALDDYYRKS